MQTNDDQSVRSALRAGRLALRQAAQAAPGALTAYALLALGQALVPVAAAWLTKLLLDGITTGRAQVDPMPVVVALVVVGLLAGAVPHLSAYFRDQLERATGLRAQDLLYAAVERFKGLARFEEPEFQDRLRLAQTAAGVTSSSMVSDLLSVAGTTVTVLSFVLSLLVVSPVMCVLVVLAAVPVVLAEIAMARRRARTTWGLGPVERREFFYSGLLSSVQAAKEIRLFAAGPFLRGRMLRERRTANAVRRRQDVVELRLQGLLALLAAGVTGAALIWSVRQAYMAQLSVGDLTLFLATVAGVQGGLVSLALSLARANEQLILFGHYLAVVTAGPDLPEPAAPVSVPRLRHGIEFRDVWFRYSDDHDWILRGVNLFVPAGATVGLVGRNGAGKSTLVKLLCRFYDPVWGAVLWDGVDLRELDVQELRGRISSVFQDFMHYDLSATDNIAFGDVRATADPALVRRAATTAGIHDDLAALPRGYDTLLTRLFKIESERDDPDTGVLLSGGQWQRVALARAFVRQVRDVMILDEPSAGLDPLAEHEVSRSLHRYRSGATSVVISHRLNTLRDADLIVVLGDGLVVETGDHESLLARGGSYAELFRTQARGYAEERGAVQSG
ncbi:ABC transporter ATP-binding protein [Micromonospora purpureochromogenes]|uniref:ABC transporter ATP-binding protein n=1 Tax=Micromonospora purpureochromogenes TaxID=47872 RepID=UPI0033DA7AFD